VLDSGLAVLASSAVAKIERGGRTPPPLGSDQRGMIGIVPGERPPSPSREDVTLALVRARATRHRVASNPTFVDEEPTGAPPRPDAPSISGDHRNIEGPAKLERVRQAARSRQNFPLQVGDPPHPARTRGSAGHERGS
jgi:hypothetical protein